MARDNEEYSREHTIAGTNFSGNQLNYMRANNCAAPQCLKMQMSSPRAVFAQFRDQRNTAATRRATGGSNVASEASYWCNPSEIQATRHSYAHAQYIQACNSAYTVCA